MLFRSVARPQKKSTRRRLLCPSAAMMLSVPDKAAAEGISPITITGKAGQTSSVSLAGVGGVQKSCRFRRRVNQKRRFSIADTHEPAVAILLLPLFLLDMVSSSYRNQMFLVGRHRVGRRFKSFHLAYITVITSRQPVVIVRNEIFTSTLFR